MSLDYPSYTSGKRLSNNTKVFKVLTKHPTQAPFFAHGDRTTEPDKVRSCAAHLAAQYPINVTRQALSAEGLPVNVAEPDVPEADGFLITMVDNMELGGNEMPRFDFGFKAFVPLNEVELQNPRTVINKPEHNSSGVERWAHNPEVPGSKPGCAT
ncbi:uncharacterized protein BDZ83DRAFT_727268 [Colletotrichum acutatum]|uniref:Uncharacterized protein n=1 Tax=Glomerella acutata TaxID=27357 RepID=A0AAD9D0X1_GLOAC|nr:uncharacterized protein BDZ83DRAFT_727268 [Colletotrichum acutatum]KAK1729580.1 hypothetical protein BDZ83DRAFT_727268 [Colletotrichum acutatum]